MTNRSLVLLSGERTSIPEAEARALFLTYDPGSRFSSPEDRILVVESSASPERVAGRIAFARRVGLLLPDASTAAEIVRGRRIRVRTFSLGGSTPHPDLPALLEGLDSSIDLENPEFELTLVIGRSEYLALTVPSAMNQGWSLRRPRRRPFFHPSAIFPKLSRALTNLTRCREGEYLLDPFAGTGSILIEAAQIGLNAVAMDRSASMVRGAVQNMKAFRQSWSGVVRADAFNAPLSAVDGIATDTPYGRSASTGGETAKSIVEQVLRRLPGHLRSGGRMVLMHPSHVPVDVPADMSLEEEHYVYIHRKLTRAITILRKV